MKYLLHRRGRVLLLRTVVLYITVQPKLHTNPKRDKDSEIFLL